MNIKGSNLIVAAYLNQRQVFDLVATAHGGIATVTRLERVSSSDESSENSVKTGFSLAEAFSSLLRIELGGERTTAESNKQQSSKSEERTHTPVSLFVSLRDFLIENNLVNSVSENMPKPGDFVEFTASMKKNPLIESLDSASELMALAGVFATEEKSKKVALGPQVNHTKAAAQMKALSESLKKGGTQNLLATGEFFGGKAIVTIVSQFLNDPTMSDLVDGTFRILGKVIRVAESDKESINLARKTSLRSAPEMIKKIVEMFANLNTKKFEFMDGDTEVPGPVFQVIPIAIFS